MPLPYIRFLLNFTLQVDELLRDREADGDGNLKYSDLVDYMMAKN